MNTTTTAFAHHRAGRGFGLVLAGLLVSACGPKSTQHSTGNNYAAMEWRESQAPASDASDTADNASQASASVPASKLRTGEHLVWRFSLFGIELGRLALAVGEPGTVDGQTVAIVQAQLETTKMAAIFAPIEQRLTSFVDVATVQPVYHRREVDKGTYYKWVEAKLDRAGFAVDYRARARDSDSHEQQTMPRDLPLFDANALLLAARSWEMQAGERIELNIFREIYVWHLQIQRAGEETVRTELGEFPAIRFDSIGRRLSRDGSYDESMAPRNYSFWISDDQQRLPLVVIAKTDYGDARMELVRYERAAAQ